MIIVSRICIVFTFFGLFCEFNVDSSKETGKVEIEKLSRKIPVLSEYAASLENHIKLRYLQKISVVGVDPANIPCEQVTPECLPPIACRKATTSIPSLPVPKSEMDIFYQALNQCETKASVLSLIDPYAEEFVAKSRNVPMLSDLFEPTNLELKYPELLQKCKDVKINVSDEEIKIVEQDTQDQARDPGFFRHQAG